MTDPTRELKPVAAAAQAPQASAALDGRTTSEAVLYEIRRVIVGQDAMLERVLVALLAGGHLLLEGVPGLAKTLTIKTLADVLDASFRRIQFTPDLVPGDLVGTRIYRPDRGDLRHRARPGLLQLPPRRRDQPRPGQGPARAARGDAGAAGHDRPREPQGPPPFLVMATQNPIESEGTYPLPEAQVDRFMMKVVVGYPTAGEEASSSSARSARPPVVRSILTADGLAELQALTADVYVDRPIVDYAVALTAATRDPGAGRPAERQAVHRLRGEPTRLDQPVHAARALALVRGRRYVIPRTSPSSPATSSATAIVPSFTALAEEVTADMILDR